MGGGSWSSVDYDAAEAARKARRESVFAYSETASETGQIHETLNPKGVTVRECVATTEHPDPTGISVFLDVTGSMKAVVKAIYDSLPTLHELILGKGYVSDPEIMFGAVDDGKAMSRAPLQVGQFESSNSMDQDLRNMWIVGDGGAFGQESYELALYFAARHTKLDTWSNGRKGYLFIIGDEEAYPEVSASEVQRFIGDSIQNISLEAIIGEVKEMYHVFMIIPTGASGGGDNGIYRFWQRHLGQNVIRLEDPTKVAETIALTIGLTEGAIDLSTGMSHLSELMPNNPRAINSIERALATVVPGVAGTSSLAKRTDLPGLDPDSERRSNRL